MMPQLVKNQTMVRYATARLPIDNASRAELLARIASFLACLRFRARSPSLTDILSMHLYH